MRRLFCISVIVAAVVLALTACKPVLVPPEAPANPPPSAGDVPKAEYKEDSGRVIGRSDRKHIQIHISGTPENMTRDFELIDVIADGYDQLGIKDGDEVKFKFQDTANGVSVIIELNKIVN